jgi:chemotaxis protein methyltransferase CheR
MTCTADNLAELELDLLLEALDRCHGHDFRHYARAPLRRRIEQALPKLGVPSIAHLLPPLLHQPGFFTTLFHQLAVTVTEMFRDPPTFQALRAAVLPQLARWPALKLWCAGCATGEEAWSLAILLHESGLYPRSQLYATDFHDLALDQARKGVYALRRMQAYTRNYHLAGGTADFVSYYQADADAARLADALRPALTFANHNLATDASFGEMHLILCRNTLIYFDRQLQDRVLTLLRDSLVPGGYLCLGRRETLAGTAVADDFAVLDAAERLYQRHPLPETAAHAC